MPIRLRISTPTEPIPPGRAFYQLEEEALHVLVGVPTSDRRPFSWLESEQVRFDLDRTGRLVFIEVTRPRRLWRTIDELGPPQPGEAADIRWLDFRSPLPPPLVLTNADRTRLKLEFNTGGDGRCFEAADGITVQTDGEDGLVALWIESIVDDLAGHEIAAFREKLLGRGRRFS